MQFVMCSSLTLTHKFIFKLSFTTDFMQAVSFFIVMSCVDVKFLHYCETTDEYVNVSTCILSPAGFPLGPSPGASG